jgi:hypothetical protein
MLALIALRQMEAKFEALTNEQTICTHRAFDHLNIHGSGA